MKVIFLDVDGVLNSDEYFEKDRGKDIYDIKRQIDVETIKLLKEAIEKTEAKVVLCSSWRYTKMAEKLIDLLLEYGVHIIDKTPFISNLRGEEIYKWLEGRKNIEDYIILDDEIFESYDEELLGHLLKIGTKNGLNAGEGLQRKNVLQIINRFGVRQTNKQSDIDYER